MKMFESCYAVAKKRGLVYANKKCGPSKDTADFDICLAVGRTDVLIPKSIPFTILSGDRGLVELENQFTRSGDRRLVVVTPHLQDDNTLYALLKRIVNT